MPVSITGSDTPSTESIRRINPKFALSAAIAPVLVIDLRGACAKSGRPMAVYGADVLEPGACGLSRECAISSPGGLSVSPLAGSPRFQGPVRFQAGGFNDSHFHRANQGWHTAYVFSLVLRARGRWGINMNVGTAVAVRLARGDSNGWILLVERLVERPAVAVTSACYARKILVLAGIAPPSLFCANVRPTN